MITTFPSFCTLLFQGHSYEVGPAVQRTQFEDGAIRQHTMVSRVLVRRKVRFSICDAMNFETFRLWVRDDLKRGTQWFLWTDPLREREGKSGEVRCRIVNGAVSYSAFEETLGIWIVDCEFEHWDY